jgi:lysophospholipase L1-like esterase
MRGLVVLAVSLLLVACSEDWLDGPPPPWMEVHALDPYVQYTGRVDYSRAFPRFAHAGSALRVRFEGRGLSVHLKEQSYGGPKRTDYFNVLIDNRPPVRLEAPPGEQVHILAERLRQGVHTIELYKRTEGRVGITEILGVEVQGMILEPPPRPERRMEVIGDSITCSYGNEVRIPAPPDGNPSTDFNAINQNFYNSYAAVAARQVGAELHNVCYSAWGLYRDMDADTSHTLPSIYDRALPEDSTSRWDLKSYVPHVVVINLGTNDFFHQPLPTQEEFIGAYERFILRLRGLYPGVHVVCMTGPSLSDYFPRGARALSTMRGYMEELVRRRRAQGDERVYHIEVAADEEVYGEDWHPTRETHEKMGNELAFLLREKLGW